MSHYVVQGRVFSSAQPMFEASTFVDHGSEVANGMGGADDNADCVPTPWFNLRMVATSVLLSLWTGKFFNMGWAGVVVPNSQRSKPML